MAECVICGRPVPLGEEEEETKPTLLNWQVVREGERKEEQRRNLRCFCKLLGLEEPSQVVGLVVEEEGKCCLECNAALEEVASLEAAMEEMRLRQKALVEQLKGYLVTAVDDQFNGNLRRQLISLCLKKCSSSSESTPPSNTPARTRKRKIEKEKPKTPSSPSTTEEPAVKMEECFVQMERLSPPYSLKRDETSKEEEEQVKVHKRASRRSKTKALQTFQHVRSRSPSPVSPSMSPEWNADYGEDASGQDDNEEGSDSASSELEEEKLGQKPPPTKLPSTRKRNMFKNFHQITDNLLLYRSTLIRVTDGKSRFTCLEPGCCTEFQDLSSWSSVFHQMQKHVEESHPWDARSGKTVPCPLCPKQLECGTPSFRKHLLKDHSLDYVVCEVCWRPIRHQASYKCHLWHHKNAEEMQNADMPPNIFYHNQRRANKSSNKKRRRCCKVLLNSEEFSRLSDNQFLYKLTVIRLAPGEGLYCEEPLCHQLIVPETGSTFNILARLAEIKEHVNQAHSCHKETYSQMERSCPLCPAGEPNPPDCQSCVHVVE